MGGDLNLKKSWHPGLQKNQEKVWKQEKQALEERRKIAELEKERAEERAVLEVQRMHEQAGGKVKPTTGLDWMYSSSNPVGSSGAAVSEEAEGYLLGKSRIDTLLKRQNDERQKAMQTSAENMAGFGNAGTSRDVASKIRDDPMLAIKKQEQAAYDAMMNDPTKRKQLLKQAGVEEKDKKHRHSRRDESERDRHRSKRRRHSDDDDRERKHRHRSHRRRSYSPSRSPSPYSRRRERSEDRYRSGRYDERDGYRSAPRQSRASMLDEEQKGSSRRYDDRDSYRPAPRPSRSGMFDEEQKEKERAAKLAAMQSNATQLEEDRKKRLEAVQAQEVADRERDEKNRTDQGRFMSGVRKQAEGMDLGETFRRRGIVAGGGGD